MILTSSPADFSSAFDDNYFRFDEVDAAVPTEITFRDSAGNLLGARRYASRRTIESSPRSLLGRLLEPQPVTTRGCRFLFGADRQATIALGYNDGADLTPEVHFTASHTFTPSHTVLGGGGSRRTIARGEHDEVAFRVATGESLVAMCGLGESVPAFLCGTTATEDGIHIFVVDADEIASRAASPEELTEFDIRLVVGGATMATIHYDLLPAVSGSVRLAWLDSKGAISYHTFPAPVEQRVMSTRSECETPYGTLLLGGSSWRESTLHSGFLSAAEVERLAEMVATPSLWLITAGSAEPQTLLSHTLTTLGDGARALRMVIRPSQVASIFRG